MYASKKGAQKEKIYRNTIKTSEMQSDAREKRVTNV